MSPVCVVTDSTCDLPARVVDDLAISVVPLNVHFGTDTYRDHVDLTPRDFYRRLVSFDGLPTTSQPPVGVFQGVYRQLGEAGNDIISIHLSSKLSGTYASALAAAQSLPELRINVVDSQSVSIGIAWPVMTAAEAALRGEGLDAVARRVCDVIPRVRLFAVLDTLEHLRRGGRIGKTSAFIGALLHVKPLIQVKEGEVTPVEKVRTKRQALRRLVEITLQHGSLERLGVAHGMAQEEAEFVVEQLSAQYPRDGLLLSEIGPVIGTHAGPRVLGASFVVK